MRCIECGLDSPTDSGFCRGCGARLESACPGCGAGVLPGQAFCPQCGRALPSSEPSSPATPSSPSQPGERKPATVLYSDLSGYSAMVERLDPEEAKGIMSLLFEEAAHAISTYGGSIEKLVGDAVMALFGAEVVHEDDPVRAIKAAAEIHGAVERLSPRFEGRVGRPLAMHTGIATGLVLVEDTGGRPRERVLGDAVNVAARLMEMAEPGQILADSDTYERAAGHFRFEPMGDTPVSGRAGEIRIFRVGTAKWKSSAAHIPERRRASLVGRTAEMALLDRTLQRLKAGPGGIVCISGDAGTGKSRLVEELHADADPDRFQWLEAHCHPYAQKIPYHLLSDLLGRAWEIDEGDGPDAVRGKIDAHVSGLSLSPADVRPHVEVLFGIEPSDGPRADPHYWKSQLFNAAEALLAALVQRGPVIVTVEDVHWADPSSTELLRHLSSRNTQLVLFVCTYRPPFALFTGREAEHAGASLEAIELRDLSPSEAEDMVASLLQSDEIPAELRRFVGNVAEGNPFYLEEVVSSLVDAGVLTRPNGVWKMARAPGGFDIPLTVHGVISARIDRLGADSKRVLQEASVLGRTFFHQVLARITRLPERVDACLDELQRLDLIRVRSAEPDIEYAFKHSLTRNVAYEGLLKSERRRIHEAAGSAMEELFQSRAAEFYENLALHFEEGGAHAKAVDYRIRSAKKSVDRYSVQEAHDHFARAFDLLYRRPDRTREDDERIVDLILDWSGVYYYRGDFRGAEELLLTHRPLVKSLGDDARMGWWLIWQGGAHYQRAKFLQARECHEEALRLGERAGDQQLVVDASSRLSNVLTELGSLDQALERALFAASDEDIIESDGRLYYGVLNAVGMIRWVRGERAEARKAGLALLDYGQRRRDVRCMVMGQWALGIDHLMDDEADDAIECFSAALRLSSDPYLTMFPRLFMALACAQNGRVEEAEEPLREVVSFAEEHGVELLGIPAAGLLGLVSMSRGDLARGLAMALDTPRTCLERHWKRLYVLSCYILGSVYARIASRSVPVSASAALRNPGFILRDAIPARRRARRFLSEAAGTADEMGARALAGQAHLELGKLLMAGRGRERAGAHVERAVACFEGCELPGYKLQAEQALAGMDAMDAGRE